jgi:hypothetical protein
MKSNTWIFKDGVSIVDCTSFPYAFRTMWNTIRKGTEKGRKVEDMIKSMSIISPIKDRNGDTKKYSYAQAIDMAKNSGLLSNDGQLNTREFKRF